MDLGKLTHLAPSGIIQGNLRHGNRTSAKASTLPQHSQAVGPELHEALTWEDEEAFRKLGYPQAVPVRHSNSGIKFHRFCLITSSIPLRVFTATH